MFQLFIGVFWSFQSMNKLTDCPDSCECYESKKDSMNIICGNIERSSLTDLTKSLHVLTFVNITFDDRVIFGPSLNYISFNHLIIEGCGGSSQATNNRRERQFVDNETLIDIPDHKSLTITNSRHIFEWKWTSFNFNQILIENSTLSAYSTILTKKFTSKVIGSNVTWLSLIDNKITSIQSGALSDLINLRYLQITRNQGLTRITRDSLPETANQLWSIDFSDNNLEIIENNLFNGMTTLIEINLSGNKLINLDYETMKFIWSQLKYLNVKDNQLSCQNLCWSLDLPMEKLSYPFTYDETDCYLHNGNKTKLIYHDEGICSFNHDKLIDIITKTTANLQIIS